MVIVDEAYVDFAGRSALELIESMIICLSYRHFLRQGAWRDAYRLCDRK